MSDSERREHVVSSGRDDNVDGPKPSEPTMATIAIQNSDHPSNNDNIPQFLGSEGALTIATTVSSTPSQPITTTISSPNLAPTSTNSTTTTIFEEGPRILIWQSGLAVCIDEEGIEDEDEFSSTGATVGSGPRSEDPWDDWDDTMGIGTRSSVRRAVSSMDSGSESGVREYGDSKVNANDEEEELGYEADAEMENIDLELELEYASPSPSLPQTHNGAGPIFFRGSGSKPRSDYLVPPCSDASSPSCNSLRASKLKPQTQTHSSSSSSSYSCTGCESDCSGCNTSNNSSICRCHARYLSQVNYSELREYILSLYDRNRIVNGNRNIDSVTVQCIPPFAGHDIERQRGEEREVNTRANAELSTTTTHESSESQSPEVNSTESSCPESTSDHNSKPQCVETKQNIEQTRA